MSRNFSREDDSTPFFYEPNLLDPVKIGDLVGIVDRRQYSVMEATVSGHDDHGPFITFRCEGGRRSYDPFDIGRFGVRFYRPVKYPGTDRLVMIGDTVCIDGRCYEVENVLPDYNRVYLKPIGFISCPISDIGYPTTPSDALGVFVRDDGCEGE